MKTPLGYCFIVEQQKVVIWNTVSFLFLPWFFHPLSMYFSSTPSHPFFSPFTTFLSLSLPHASLLCTHSSHLSISSLHYFSTSNLHVSLSPILPECLNCPLLSILHYPFTLHNSFPIFATKKKYIYISYTQHHLLTFPRLTHHGAFPFLNTNVNTEYPISKFMFNKSSVEVK